MEKLNYSQLKGQLLILQQISNPSSYILEAIKQIKIDLEKLEAEDKRFGLIDKATQEIENIRLKYPELVITYSIEQAPTREITRKIPEISIRPPINVVTHLTTLNKDYTYKDPRSIIFQNKEYTGVKYWKDVLETVCNLMQKKHPDKINRIMSISGKKRLYFAQSTSKLNSEEAKKAPRKIKNTNIYMEHNFSANRHVDVCYRVIDLFGYNRSDLNFITY